jgi:hypothetical protein
MFNGCIKNIICAALFFLQQEFAKKDLHYPPDHFDYLPDHDCRSIVKGIAPP